MRRGPRPGPHRAAQPGRRRSTACGTREVLELMNDAGRDRPGRRAPGAARRSSAPWTRSSPAGAAGGRLFYFGAGTSGRLGVLDASECPPTFSSPPGAGAGHHRRGRRRAPPGGGGRGGRRPGRGAGRARGQAPGAADVVVGPGGQRVDARTSSAPWRRRGSRAPSPSAWSATRGAASERRRTWPSRSRSGPEVVTGSTRLKAGTAQKLVLNMLTTAAMVRSGKVYGNLMVDLHGHQRQAPPAGGADRGRGGRDRPGGGPAPAGADRVPGQAGDRDGRRAGCDAGEADAPAGGRRRDAAGRPGRQPGCPGRPPAGARSGGQP